MFDFTKMWRSVAILLLLIICSFLSAPLFAASSDLYGNLPACCRKNGKHHCIMRMSMERILSDQPGHHLSAPFEKCPLFPETTPPASIQTHSLMLVAGRIVDVGLRYQLSCTSQAEAQYRISFDRSHQKRGPPEPHVS